MNPIKRSRIPPANRYHGLKNQGATCYLNSVLQVLFMTKEFREAVKGKKPETECIDPHLTTLFDDLTKRTAHTCDITKKMGISRVHEQRDAAEYFEKILSHTSPEASKIFRGQLTHENKCSVCDIEINTDGPFWSLPLALTDSYSENYSVVDGIKEFFKDSHVSGENQMYCDQCDAKADATIKCVITHHPEVLVLLLKRFEFDYHYMAYVKISRRVDVPSTLQIPQDETYELYGFVDHFGDLRGGHYTATIKCQDDKKWYNFNDTMVRSVDNQPFQVDNIMKSSSAYLLFYRKKNVKAADTSQDIREESINGGFQSDTSRSSEQSDVRSRKREKDEEAAEGDLYTVDKPENKKKRIVDNREDTERKTGDDKHVEEREKILEKNNHGEGRDNERVDQTRQKGAADYQNSKQSKRCKKKRSSKQYHKKDVKHQGKETLDNVRQNESEDQEGEQMQESVCVDKQRDEEKLVTDVKVDEEITAGAGQRGKASVTLITKSDLLYGLQNNEGVGDENMSMNQGISNTSHTRHEQQREEKRDVKEDKEHMTRELKHAQMGDTSMTHQDKGKLGDVRQEQRSGQNSVCVENKGDEEIKEKEIEVVVELYSDNRRVDDFRQNKPNDEQEDKQVEKMDGKGVRQRKRGDDECAQRRGTSDSHCSDGVEDKPQEQLEEEISRRDVGVENQRVHSVQMRPCDQEKKHIMGGRDHPQQEVQITHSGIQNSNSNMTTETAAETFGGSLSRQLSDDKRKDKRKSDPKADLHTLSGVRSLKHNVSPPPAPVEEEKETKSAIESNVEKMAKESDSQRQAVRTKHESEVKGRRDKKQLKKGKKNSKLKTFSCGLFCKPNKGQSSDSEEYEPV